MTRNETNKDYRISHQGEGFGRRYEETLMYRWQKFLLQFEQNYLGKILHKYFPIGKFQAMDFACGTGRVLSFIKKSQCDLVGVDISPDMLEVCGQKNPEVTLFCADLTENDECLKGCQFDIITAFRFFPNAEPTLRQTVLDVLLGHLKPDGILVINNHRSSTSPLYMIGKLLGKKMPSMHWREVRDLMAKNGLVVVEKKGFGVLPATNQYYLAPPAVHKAVDWLASLLRLTELLAQDVVYVCRRDTSAVGT